MSAEHSSLQWNLQLIWISLLKTSYQVYSRLTGTKIQVHAGVNKHNVRLDILTEYQESIMTYCVKILFFKSLRSTSWRRYGTVLIIPSSKLLRKNFLICNMHGNIPNLLDYWAKSFDHLLLLKNFPDQPAWTPFYVGRFWSKMPILKSISRQPLWFNASRCIA